MDVKIVDASALGALVFLEPEREQIAYRLEGAQLFAPWLLSYEMINICWVKMRRHPELRDSLLEAFTTGNGLRIERKDVEPRETLALAERFGLSGYDASYLWLAHRLDAELITLDRQLARAEAQLRR